MKESFLNILKILKKIFGLAGWEDSKWRRALFLIYGALLGLVFAVLIYCWSSFILCLSPSLVSSLTLLSLSLPVLIILWLFRTYDTREQIEKTQEQIKKTQEQVNLGMLSKGLDLIISNEVKNKINGFSLLNNLKNNQKVFQKEIDFAINNINFNDTDLSGMDLSGLDLSGISFIKAKMVGTNLKGAVLKNANLKKAIFKKEDVSDIDMDIEEKRIGDWENANFEGANLSHIDIAPYGLHSTDGGVKNFTMYMGVKNVDKAILKGCNLLAAQLQNISLAEMDLSGVNLITGLYEENKLNTCTVSYDTKVYSEHMKFFSQKAQEVLREGERRREEKRRIEREKKLKFQESENLS